MFTGKELDFMIGQPIVSQDSKTGELTYHTQPTPKPSSTFADVFVSSIKKDFTPS